MPDHNGRGETETEHRYRFSGNTATSRAQTTSPREPGQSNGEKKGGGTPFKRDICTDAVQAMRLLLNGPSSSHIRWNTTCASRMEFPDGREMTSATAFYAIGTKAEESMNLSATRRSDSWMRRSYVMRFRDRP